VVLGPALIALALIPLYLVGYRSPPYHPPSPGLRASIKTSLQVVGQALGPAARPIWKSAGLVVIAILAIGAVVLVRVWRRQPGERLRASGLFLFLASVGSLVLVMGWGRAGRGAEAGFENRYGTLVAPALCCSYFIWTLYGPPVVSSLARMTLFSVACALVYPNTERGLQYAGQYRRQMDALVRDIESGVPNYLLVKRYVPSISLSYDLLPDYLTMLRRAGVGRFRALRENPAFREVAVPVVPSALHKMTWEVRTALGEGAGQYLEFDLKETRFVCGVRLRHPLSNGKGVSARFLMYWKRGDQDAFAEDRWFWTYGLGMSPEETTTTIWVGDEVRQIRIHPDDFPCVFRIEELVLLVPADGPDAARLR
jgi:hypothetical protein